MPTEHRLKEIPEINQVRKRLLLGLELDEQVDVTVRTRSVPAD